MKMGSGASKFLERLDVAIETAMFASSADQIDSLIERLLDGIETIPDPRAEIVNERALGLYDTIVRIVTPSDAARSHPDAATRGQRCAHAGLLLQMPHETKAELAAAMCELRAYMEEVRAGNVDERGEVVSRRQGH